MHHHLKLAHPVAPTPSPFPPLETISRPAITTAEAAFYLNRKTQTLRIWAMRESGPLRPLRVHGRLAWSTEEIRKLLGQ